MRDDERPDPSSTFWTAYGVATVACYAAFAVALGLADYWYFAD